MPSADSITPSEPSPPPVETPSSSSYQAPRSLRMLFEDSSIPPPLPENFRNNLGSSRHGGQPLGVAASAPSNPSFLSPALSSSSAMSSDPTLVGKESLDDSDLHTARQTNFAFPRLAAPKAEFDDVTAKIPARRGHHSPRGSATAGNRRSPSPFKESKPPSTPPGVKSPAEIIIPTPASGSFMGATGGLPGSPADPRPPFGGTPAISVGRAETPTRAAFGEDGSPKASQTKLRKAASPMNFQFPPQPAPGGRSTKSHAGVRDREAMSSSPAPQSRPHTPSSKEPRLGTSLKETSVLEAHGLTPPKPLVVHHPASRSMDSPRTGGTTTAANGNGLLAHPPPLGRSHTAAVYGSQSDSEALGGRVDNNRLNPGRPMALKRQASVETGLSLGGLRTGALRDALQVR